MLNLLTARIVPSMVVLPMVLSVLAPATQAVPQIVDTYRAGEYTITIGGNHPTTGYTYRGCDRQARCIDLSHGTSWQDGPLRGITWENGEHYYAVSWRQSSRGNTMQLTVYQGDRVLLQASMVPIVES